MQFLSNYLKGIAIGAGAILPGISSGVFCVIFGIYEKLLDSILNFFSDIKNNFKFLFPIIIGIGFSIVLFSKVLNYCLYQFPIQTKSIFNKDKTKIKTFSSNFLFIGSFYWN